MSRKTTTFTAIAALAVAAMLIPTGPEAAALAEAAQDQHTDPAPAEAPEPELVPQVIEYVSREVVQPLRGPSPSPAFEPEAPVLTEAGSLNELVGMIDTAAPMDKELRCLAGAVYFEARGEPIDGQLAVAQVIVNRTEDGRFPRSYCDVVAQPGQFSFMRGRAMPRVREGSPAWRRAVAVARIADKGLWESEVGDAVFFHARYVRPGWSQRKVRLAQIDTHIFYR